MIFVRFKGPASPEFVFTPGKMYFARPAMDGAETVGFDFIEAEDDAGDMTRVNPEEDLFEFFDEVYAVVLHPFEEMDAGDVTLLDGIDDGQLNVKGFGLRNSQDLAVLDRTNLFPGVSVLDSSSGLWEKVKRVDECMWVLVDDQNRMRSPAEFKFAVADGRVLVEPLVKCLDAAGEPCLTKGKLYYLKRTDKDGFIVLMNDDGAEAIHSPDRFEME
jgi:hypothetical protein